MIDLRAFAYIDRLQRQFVGYIGSTARGYYPVAGQSALFLEIAPGIETELPVGRVCAHRWIDDLRL